MGSKTYRTLFPELLCYRCKHWIEPKGGPRAPTCQAFPDGIPFPIASGQIPHVTPYPNDHGIMFESDGQQPDPDSLEDT